MYCVTFLVFHTNKSALGHTAFEKLPEKVPRTSPSCGQLLHFGQLETYKILMHREKKNKQFWFPMVQILTESPSPRREAEMMAVRSQRALSPLDII